MLVERDRELRSLRDAFGACRDGRGGTVLVSGEAGIGKTSLLTAFAGEAAAAGASVLLGACDDLHTARGTGAVPGHVRPGLRPVPGGGAHHPQQTVHCGL